MTDPTPPHRRSPLEHERDACPYCAEDVLTIAHFQGVAFERERSAARIEALEDHIANMLAAQECACGYDNPTDICLGHATVLKRIEALEAENGRLQEIIREAHDAMKDGADATAWAFLRAALKGEGE